MQIRNSAKLKNNKESLVSSKDFTNPSKEKLLNALDQTPWTADENIIEPVQISDSTDTTHHIVGEIVPLV